MIGLRPLHQLNILLSRSLCPTGGPNEALRPRSGQRNGDRDFTMTGAEPNFAPKPPPPMNRYGSRRRSHDSNVSTVNVEPLPLKIWPYPNSQLIDEPSRIQPSHGHNVHGERFSPLTAAVGDKRAIRDVTPHGRGTSWTEFALTIAGSHAVVDAEHMLRPFAFFTLGGA